MEEKEEAIKDILDKMYWDRGKLPFIIPIDAGLDAEVEGFTVHKNWGKNRRIQLNIKDFSAFGNVHYYGDITVDGISFTDSEGYIIAGYGAPNLSDVSEVYTNSYHIELTRLVTSDDIKYQPSRWKYYEVGYKTPAFNSKKDLLTTFYEVVKHRFPDPQWFIVIYDNSRGELADDEFFRSKLDEKYNKYYK